MADSGKRGGAPTVGGAILVSNGPGGWDPPCLLLTTPLVLLRYARGVTTLWQAGAEAPFHASERSPLVVLEEVLAAIRARLPKVGSGAGKPAFPLAMIAATYEFGQRFTPHEHAFPHAGALRDDEFFASIFIDAFRPDSQGGTERVGYAGVIPAGWMAGAPELAATAPGHDAPPLTPWPVSSPFPAEYPKPMIGHESHAALVEIIRAYLAAGDTYQVNLTVPLAGRSAVSPEAVFDIAMERGGAAYGALFLTPTATIASFSPELYLRRRGARIETRPIKGTRAIPTHLSGVVDAKADLLSSDKDRAEHVMIVDLERNDLGRVCLYGSVEADPLMRATAHPGLVHLESTVAGTLRAGVTLEQIFAATFPGGSVTGAPKRRALEIIAELETAPRGIYCGALGWIDADGDMELNLPIRTAVFRVDGSIEYHAGGGIVADSVAGMEWEELHAKVEFFMEALFTAEHVREA